MMENLETADDVYVVGWESSPPEPETPIELIKLFRKLCESMIENPNSLFIWEGIIANIDKVLGKAGR